MGGKLPHPPQPRAGKWRTGPPWQQPCLVIERPILELLGIDDATELEMHTDGKRLTFTPVTRGEHQEKLRETCEKKTLRTLFSIANK